MPVDFSARKKLIHAMPLNTAPAINRAMVVRCAISATRNYLKLHMPQTLNPLLCNVHAETRKLWRFAMRIAASRPDHCDQSVEWPSMHSKHFTRFPSRAPELASAHTCRPRHASVAPAFEVGANIKSP